MKFDRLYQILSETTAQLRKGEVLEGTPELVEQVKAGKEPTVGGVLEIYALPHVDDAKPDIEKVDMQFIVIGVDRAKAERHKQELISILNQMDPDMMSGGPSYITMGGLVGDQGAAFQLFALGKVLGLWSVITPATFGFKGEEARKLAGAGMVMISGYPKAAA